jgi:hypothetical protein
MPAFEIAEFRDSETAWFRTQVTFDTRLRYQLRTRTGKLPECLWAFVYLDENLSGLLRCSRRLLAGNPGECQSDTSRS